MTLRSYRQGCVALVALLLVGCSEPITPHPRSDDADMTPISPTPVVQFSTLNSSGSSPLTSPPFISAAPDSGDPCSGLEISIDIDEMGEFVEAIIAVYNPNEGTWSGELNLTFETESEPFVRHVLMDNVGVELQSHGAQSYFVLMLRPHSSGTYRAFGISGEGIGTLLIPSIDPSG